MRKRIFPSVMLAISLLCRPGWGAAPLTSVSPGNQDGLCYWHCAQAILDTEGAGRDLISEVKASGNTIASLPNIERYVQVWPIPLYSEAKELTTKGTHVIANVRFDLRFHAVKMIDVSGGIVTYWDPDRPRQNQRMLEGEFAKRYLMGTVVR